MTAPAPLATPHSSADAPPTAAALSRPRSRGARLAAFVRRDLVRQLKLVESIFFIAVLPTALFLMFGTMGEWSGETVAHGNVMAYTMSGMAMYGAVTATTSIAGSAAVERQLGWGRQLSLTALRSADYMAGKTLVALSVAVLPILLVLGTGALVGADLHGAGRWLATGGLVLLGSLPFALYGLAAALLFRSEAAVSAASGGLVVFGFLGNLFIPLNDVLLDIARFTPMYGPGLLARWPQMEGSVMSMYGDTTTEPLGLALVNIAVWTAVFAGLCVLGARRRTAR